MFVIIYLSAVLIGCIAISLEWSKVKFLKYHLIGILLLICISIIGSKEEMFPFWWDFQYFALYFYLPVLVSFVSGLIFGALKGEIRLTDFE